MMISQVISPTDVCDFNQITSEELQKKVSIRRIYALQLIEGSILRYLILNLPAIAITFEVHNRYKIITSSYINYAY